MRGLGIAGNQVHGMTMGLLDRTLNLQAAVQAYSDIFALSAVLAFGAVPLTLLFRPGAAGRNG